ncbi:MAG: hypothetical protein AAFQ34_16360, partial [Pseudomonadota bacterium]
MPRSVRIALELNTFQDATYVLTDELREAQWDLMPPERVAYEAKLAAATAAAAAKPSMPRKDRKRTRVDSLLSMAPPRKRTRVDSSDKVLPDLATPMDLEEEEEEPSSSSVALDAPRPLFAEYECMPTAWKRRRLDVSGHVALREPVPQHRFQDDPKLIAIHGKGKLDRQAQKVQA